MVYALPYQAKQQTDLHYSLNTCTLVLEQLTLLPSGFSVRRVHVGLNWRRKKPGYGPAASATI